MTTAEASRDIKSSQIWVKKWCAKNAVPTGPWGYYVISAAHLERMRKEFRGKPGRPKVAKEISV